MNCNVIHTCTLHGFYHRWHFIITVALLGNSLSKLCKLRDSIASLIGLGIDGRLLRLSFQAAVFSGKIFPNQGSNDHQESQA